jgi:hypothetical protein
MFEVELVPLEPHRQFHALARVRGLRQRPSSARFSLSKVGAETFYLGPKGWQPTFAECHALKSGWDAERGELWLVIGPDVIQFLDDGPFTFTLAQRERFDGIFPPEELLSPGAAGLTPLTTGAPDEILSGPAPSAKSDPAREAAAREAAVRDAAAREAAAREAAAREAAVREFATRDAAARDGAVREIATRDAAAHEAATRAAAAPIRPSRRGRLMFVGGGLLAIALLAAGFFGSRLPGLSFAGLVAETTSSIKPLSDPPHTQTATADPLAQPPKRPEPTTASSAPASFECGGVANPQTRNDIPADVSSENALCVVQIWIEAGRWREASQALSSPRFDNYPPAIVLLGQLYDPNSKRAEPPADPVFAKRKYEKVIRDPHGYETAFNEAKRRLARLTKE